MAETGPRRSRRGFVLLLALFALLVSGGSAAADETGSPCPPEDGGRLFCITIADTDGVSPSPDPETGEPANHMRYVVTVTNVGSPTLTHGELSVELTDLPLGTEGVTTASLASASSSRGDVCDALTGGGAVCNFGRLAAGESFTATLGYTTSHTEGVVATRMDATASVDEHERDGDDPRDPTREARTASNVTEYETRADFGLTFVPSTQTDVNVATSLSSLSFTTPGLESFFAEIQDFASDPSHCFKGVSCLPQTTRGDLTTTSDVGPILWQRRITGVTKGTSPTTIVSIHFADPVSVSVNPSTNTFATTTSFVRIDGVRFTTDGSLPGGLRPGVDYFVVNATANSFQVSTNKGGKPLDITSSGSGPLLAERIRIIGDQADERWTSCSTPPSSLPAIVAQLVSKTVIDTCVWTSENGWMK